MVGNESEYAEYGDEKKWRERSAEKKQQQKEKKKKKSDATGERTEWCLTHLHCWTFVDEVLKLLDEEGTVRAVALGPPLAPPMTA